MPRRSARTHSALVEIAEDVKVERVEPADAAQTLYHGRDARHDGARILIVDGNEDRGPAVLAPAGPRHVAHRAAPDDPGQRHVEAPGEPEAADEQQRYLHDVQIGDAVDGDDDEEQRCGERGQDEGREREQHPPQNDQRLYSPPNVRPGFGSRRDGPPSRLARGLGISLGPTSGARSRHSAPHAASA